MVSYIKTESNIGDTVVEKKLCTENVYRKMTNGHIDSALCEAMLHLKGCKVKKYVRTFSLKTVIISNP